MFDEMAIGLPPDPDPDPPGEVPLERLEARICELAGHRAAATCRFLGLLGDFDARRGWASWEMGSCAQWLVLEMPDVLRHCPGACPGRAGFSIIRFCETAFKSVTNIEIDKEGGRQLQEQI